MLCSSLIFLWWDTVLGEAQPLSLLIFHLEMLSPTTMFSHILALLLSTLDCTVLATNWKSNKILIISCQLFSVSFHSKMSSGWQQHTECNCACATAWWGSSPEGFPSRHIFTHLSLPNGLEQLYVYQYYYQHCYHQSLEHRAVSQQQCSAHVSMISVGSLLHLCLNRCLKPTATTATGI